jgi:membrane protein
MTPGQTNASATIGRAAALRSIFAQFGDFVRHVVLRFVNDGCFSAAGALSYTTLVSLVPLMAIALAVLSAFPIFDTAREQVLNALFRNFVPEVGDTAEQYFTAFAASAGKTTAVGIAVLGFTAIMLLATIEDRLDAIWRVTAPRPWITRVLIYWTVLTLGPILLAVGLSLSGSFSVFTHRVGLEGTPVAVTMSGWLSGLRWLVPLLLETVALTLIYCLMPHCVVRWRDGAIGAFIAALLFEATKSLFSLYISTFASYQAVYGALAAIPIFLLWMYLSWAVVLFGAVVAAAVPRWRMERNGAEGFRRVPDLALGLALLDALAEAARHGGSMQAPALARLVHAAPGTVADYLALLARAGFVVEASNNGWVLSRDLGTATLAELRQALEAPLGADRPSRWAGRLEPVLAATREAEDRAMSMPIAVVLSGRSPESDDEPAQPVVLGRGRSRRS